MERIMQEFPIIFDGHMRMMEGEEFHIISGRAVPLWYTYRERSTTSVPFAYIEKLIVEMELLQEQGITMPVTKVTEWYAPMMVTPKMARIV